MRHLARRTLAGLVLLGLSTAAAADQFSDARQWLERMAEAMDNLSYQGTFVVMRGQDVETLRLTRIVDGDAVQERLVALSGPHRELIRDAQGTQAVMAAGDDLAGRTATSPSAFPSLPTEALEQARGRYLFEVGKLARIAGHKGRKVSILPKDEFRYGYDFWIEPETGLLLRWVLYDASRRPLAKLMFTDLVTGEAVDASELKTETPAGDFVPLATATDADQGPPSEAPGWQRIKLPPGFQLEASHRQGSGDGDEFEHLLISDGLVSVSVYIESSDAARELGEGLSRLGTTHAWSRRAGDRQVTAIGEVPAVTVRLISKAFARPLGGNGGR